MTRIITTLFVCFLITGCATQSKPPRVYWGQYSKTLYQLKSEPSEVTAAQHKAQLEEIVSKSQEWGIKPPPGICAELGKVYFERGQTDLAVEFMNKEAVSYPESSQLMTQIIQKIKNKS